MYLMSPAPPPVQVPMVNIEKHKGHTVESIHERTSEQSIDQQHLQPSSPEQL